MDMDHEGGQRGLDGLFEGESSEDGWYFDLPKGAWERQEAKNRQLRETLHRQAEGSQGGDGAGRRSPLFGRMRDDGPRPAQAPPGRAPASRLQLQPQSDAPAPQPLHPESLPLRRRSQPETPPTGTVGQEVAAFAPAPGAEDEGTSLVEAMRNWALQTPADGAPHRPPLAHRPEPVALEAPAFEAPAEPEPEPTAVSAWRQEREREKREQREQQPSRWDDAFAGAPADGGMLDSMRAWAEHGPVVPPRVEVPEDDASAEIPEEFLKPFAWEEEAPPEADVATVEGPWSATWTEPAHEEPEAAPAASTLAETHVELPDVPVAEAANITEAPREGGGFLSRLFGRKKSAPAATAGAAPEEAPGWPELLPFGESRFGWHAEDTTTLDAEPRDWEAASMTLPGPGANMPAGSGHEDREPAAEDAAAAWEPIALDESPPGAPPPSRPVAFGGWEPDDDGEESEPGQDSLVRDSGREALVVPDAVAPDATGAELEPWEPQSFESAVPAAPAEAAAPVMDDPWAAFMAAREGDAHEPPPEPIRFPLPRAAANWPGREQDGESPWDSLPFAEGGSDDDARQGHSDVLPAAAEPPHPFHTRRFGGMTNLPAHPDAGDEQHDDPWAAVAAASGMAPGSPQDIAVLRGSAPGTPASEGAETAPPASESDDVVLAAFEAHAATAEPEPPPAPRPPAVPAEESRRALEPLLGKEGAELVIEHSELDPVPFNRIAAGVPPRLAEPGTPALPAPALSTPVLPRAGARDPQDEWGDDIEIEPAGGRWGKNVEFSYDSESPPPPTPAVHHGHRRRTIVREVVETGLLALLVFLSVRASFQNFKVDGNSMYPTLENGQFLIVNKLVYSEVDVDKLSKFVPFVDPGDSPKRNIFHGPERGDIIVLQDPRDPSVDLIKRVIALPGETVQIDHGKVYINDRLLEEPYIKSPWSGSYPKTLIPAGEYFVLGDNRDNSLDSRSPAVGLVHEDLIIGKAMLSYWPSSKFGLAPNASPGMGEEKPKLTSRRIGE